MMDESSLERLIEITEEALRDAYEKVVGLGEKGKEESGDVNELGDVTFRADMVAGKAVFDSLRRKNLNIRIVSEESRKRVKIGNANQFLGVIDEIDGSRPYKKGIGRYATMFAIFDGLSPFYNDYLVSGILDYLNKQIYLAAKAKGAYILELENGKKHSIFCSTVSKLNRNGTRIRIDGGIKENTAFFVNKLTSFKKVIIGTPESGGSSCDDFISLASGDVDLVLQCTRKRNLEIAVAYGLIIEAGGVLVDVSGQSLGKQKYLEFGQNNTDRIPVISAATPELSSALVNYLKSQS